MKNNKKFFSNFFQTKHFLDVNIFASDNDHYLRLNLIYAFIYKNSFAFNYKNIPTSCVLQNQKNFFNFLNSCATNGIEVTFFSNTVFKNLTKSLNFLFLFSKINHADKLSTTDVVVYLDNKFNNKINTKNDLVISNSLIIKPISLDSKIDFQIYYLLIDLSNDLNKFMYLNLIKSFLLISRQTLYKNNFKKYFFLKKIFQKLLK